MRTYAIVSLLLSALQATSAFQSTVGQARGSFLTLSRRRIRSLHESSYGSASWEERIVQRRQRYQQVESIKTRFASGKELENIRSDVEKLKENLGWAEAICDEDRVRDLRKAIEAGEARDPETAYAIALKRIDEAKASPDINRDNQIEKWTIEAAAARDCIPRFGLEGLWVGNYGEHGFEMINVTYSGDTLVATKVTGDKNVPRGEISFEANMSERGNAKDDELPPIELSPESAAKWGLDKLTRYPGKGQVAKPGFVDSKFVDGQLIMFENHFSFVWTPSRHHVFFGRPNANVSLRMLRDIISEEDTMQNLRDHVKLCFELDLTTTLARQHCNQGREPFRRIKRERDLQKMKQKSQKEPPKENTKSIQDFFDFRQWKHNIDEVMGENKGK